MNRAAHSPCYAPLTTIISQDIKSKIDSRFKITLHWRQTEMGSKKRETISYDLSTHISQTRYIAVLFIRLSRRRSSISSCLQQKTCI